MLTIAGGIILGWIGITLIRAMLATASEPRLPSPRSPPPVLTMTEYERAKDAELRRLPDRWNAERNAAEIGLVVAFASAQRNEPFATVFKNIQRTSVAEMERLQVFTMRLLFAIDTMPDSTWKDAQAAMLAGDAAIDTQIRAWRERRLAGYLKYKMRDFDRLSQRSSFRAFAQLADHWSIGVRERPPQWWTDEA